MKLKKIVPLFLALLFLFIPLISWCQWKKVNRPQDSWIYDFELIGDTILMGSANGLYMSISNGEVWNAIRANGESCRYIETLGDTIYAIEDQKNIIYSNNFGTTWEEINFSGVIQNLITIDGYLFYADPENLRRIKLPSLIPELLYDSPSPLGISLRHDGVGNLWMACADGLLKSADYGNSWDTISIVAAYGSLAPFAPFMAHGDTIIYRNVDLFISTDGGIMFDTIQEDIHQISIFAIRNNVLYAKIDSKMYTSVDLGETWTLLLDGHPWAGNLLINGNSLFFGSSSSGCARSINNGINWHWVNTGITMGPNFSLPGQLSVADDLLVTNSHSTFSKNGGLSWRGPYIREDNFTPYNVAKKDGIYYGVLENKTLYKSFGDITQWEEINTINFPGINVTQLFRLNNDLIACTTDSIYRSEDDGLNWQSTGTNPQYNNGVVGNESFIYTLFQDSLYRSDDFGQTWFSTNNKMLLNFNEDFKNLFYSHNDRLYTIVMSLNDETDSHGIYLSEDEGLSWTKLSGLFENDPFYKYGFINLSDAGLLYYRETAEIYFSPDFGITWGTLNSGFEELPGIGIEASAATKDAFYFYLETEDIWRRDFSSANIYSASGTVYEDENNDGLFNSNEKGLPNIILKTQNSNQYATTDSLGRYLLPFDGTNETVRVVAPIFQNEPNPPFIIVDSSATDVDFGIHFPATVKNLFITHVTDPVFRPGFDATVSITYRNNGTSLDNGMLSIELDPLLNLISSEPAPDVVIGNTLKWNYNFLEIYPKNFGNIKMVVNLPASVPLGTSIINQSSIGPFSNDIDTTNNVHITEDIVVGSYDPNDKKVEPSTFTNEDLDNGTPLEYTVRFQNTGTYPASFVIIRDTLSELLDPSTFRVLASSHPMVWELYGEGILKFQFDNINLPDSSSNEIESHGFVKYLIQPFGNLQIGDEIKNTAYIYFDFNAPIVTNTTITTISHPNLFNGKVLKSDLLISPNPSNGRLQIKLPENIYSEGMIRIFDIYGKIVWEERSNYQLEKTINLGRFAKGVYIIKWEIGEYLFSGKIVLN